MSGESIDPRADLPYDQLEGGNANRVLAFLNSQDEGLYLGAAEASATDSVEAGVEGPPLSPQAGLNHDMFQGWRSAVRNVQPIPPSREQSRPVLRVDASALYGQMPLSNLEPVTSTPIFQQVVDAQRASRPMAQVVSLQDRGPLRESKSAPVAEQIIAEEDRGGADDWFTPALLKRIVTNAALPIRLVSEDKAAVYEARRNVEGALQEEKTPEAEVIEQPEVEFVPEVANQPEPEQAAKNPTKTVHGTEAAEQKMAAEIGASYEVNETVMTLRGLRDSVVEYAGRHKRMVQVAELAGTVAAAAIVGARLFSRLRRR